MTSFAPTGISFPLNISVCSHLSTNLLKNLSISASRRSKESIVRFFSGQSLRSSCAAALASLTASSC